MVKNTRRLALRRETLSELRDDTLASVGGGTIEGCAVAEMTPKCPVFLSYQTECQTLPALECLVSGIAC